MKASEKYWIKGSQPNTPLFTSPELFKKTYDQLVSIESKIEVLEMVLQVCSTHEEEKYLSWIEGYETEYEYLIKKNNLWEQSEK